MSYEISIERSAQKSLAKIDTAEQQKIINAIYELKEEPRPPDVKKLKGRKAWRIRIGNYRVIYEIFDDKLVILVVSIGHRKEVYR